MRALIVAVCLFTVAVAAHAQQRAVAAHLAGTPNGYYSANYGLSGQRTDVPDDKQTCLIRKSNGRRECRTFAEWRKVAAAIDAANARHE